MKNSLTCTSEKVHLSQPVLPIPTNNEVHVRTEHSSLYARVFICYIAFISVNRDCITAIQFSYSNQSSNPPPGIWLFWKLSLKKQPPPPTQAKMLFKGPTVGFIQVIKCPHPRNISQALEWQKDGKNAFSFQTKSLKIQQIIPIQCNNNWETL